MKLSIIIPVYNEEKTIEHTTKTYVEFFDKKIKKKYEIIIIPNGCKDNTVEKVTHLSKKYSQVRLFDLGSPGEKGKAVIKGFELAKGDFIGFVDADLSTSPRSFYDLVSHIDTYDGIIASRAIKGAKITLKQSLLRRVLGKGFNLLVKVILRLMYNDTQCGAKVFKKEAIKKIYPQIKITKWAFDIDILYLMKANNFKVKEFPTEWNEIRGSSSVNIWKAAPEMFFSLLKVRFIHSKYKNLVHFFEKERK